jgi:hypothetical protein
MSCFVPQQPLVSRLNADVQLVPAAVADNSRHLFPLQFNLNFYIIVEIDDALLLNILQIVITFLYTCRRCKHFHENVFCFCNRPHGTLVTG